jgi:hypothetical protein
MSDIIYRLYLGKTAREVITWRPRQGWWNNVATDLIETECECVDWNHVGQWQAVCYGNQALVAEED